MAARPGGRPKGWTRAIAGIVVRPGLWPTALRQVHRTARSGWWHRPPFVPLPDRAYTRFRLETQYGDDATVAPADLVRYLEWCRAEERAIATGRSDGRR
jgi:hypothetical protein